MAKKAPFDFNGRTALAKTYMDDGAYLSAARVLDMLAGEIRQAGEAQSAALDSLARIQVLRLSPPKL